MLMVTMLDVAKAAKVAKATKEEAEAEAKAEVEGTVTTTTVVVAMAKEPNSMESATNAARGGYGHKAVDCWGTVPFGKGGKGKGGNGKPEISVPDFNALITTSNGCLFGYLGELMEYFFVGLFVYYFYCKVEWRQPLLTHRSWPSLRQSSATEWLPFRTVLWILTHDSTSTATAPSQATNASARV